MDSAGCISSPGFGDGEYPSDDKCLIAVAPDNTLPINVIAFNTGKDDFLVVNGVAYFGSASPMGIVPTENITWSTDAWLE